MIYRLYEWIVLSGIEVLPSQLCFMITGDDLWDAPDKLDEVVTWCHEVNLSWMTLKQDLWILRRSGQSEGLPSISAPLILKVSSPTSLPSER